MNTKIIYSKFHSKLNQKFLSNILKFKNFEKFLAKLVDILRIIEGFEIFMLK